MDNFFKLWGNIRHREVTPGVPSTTNPSAPENQPNKVKSGSFEANIYRPRSPQSALTISAVYRAVELRAKTEMQFMRQYQMFNYAGNNYIPCMTGLGKRLNYLLQIQPNPTMTAASLWEQVTIHRLMLGNAVVYIERDEFEFPLRLWLSQSASLDVSTGCYNLTYMSEFGPVTKTMVPRADVLHFLNTYRTSDGLWGYSTIQYAIDSLTLLKTESKQALESAAKGGRVKLLIGEDRTSSQGLLSGGLYTKEQTKKYAEEINNEIYSQDVVSLRGLDKAQPISMTAQEMQTIELLGMGMDDVARYYGTPRPLLMLDTNSHYTTPTNATLEYMTRTIQPDIEEDEQELQRKFISEKDFEFYRVHLCEQPLLRLDKEGQAKVDEINLRTGAATVNEIRQQYDRPAVPNGNLVYVSTNLKELGSDKQKGKANNTKPQNDEKTK